MSKEIAQSNAISSINEIYFENALTAQHIVYGILVHPREGTTPATLHDNGNGNGLKTAAHVERSGVLWRHGKLDLAQTARLYAAYLDQGLPSFILRPNGRMSRARGQNACVDL
jgi:hypothetical protein